MTNVTTNPTIMTTLSDAVGVMNENMFGAIANNNFGWNYYVEHREELGLTDIRFPGGTISETGWIVNGRIRVDGGDISLDTLDGDRSRFAFDLTHPELISPLALEYDELNHLRRDDVATFSQVLAKAVESDVALTLIVPIERYYVDEDLSNPTVRAEAIEAAMSDLSVFLERLKNGEYNNGDYPDPLIFDIGNEQYKNPIEAAIIGKAMIDKIEAELSNTDISFEISYQMGRGRFDYVNRLNEGYFDPFFDGDYPLVPGLEDIGFKPNRGLSDAEKIVAIDKMMISILGDTLGHIDNLRHHLLGFSSDDLDGVNAPLKQRAEIVTLWMNELDALGVDTSKINYYASAITTNSSNGYNKPYELSAAANILALYDYLLEMGVDSAAFWGVTSEFRYKDTMRTTTITDRLSDFDSPQAALLKLMTGNVMTSDYLGSGGSDEDGYTSYTYESDDAYHVFLNVEYINDAEGFVVDVDLGILSDLTTVTVTNLDIADGTLNGASRVSEAEVEVLEGKVQVRFDQDFEIAMLTLEKDASASYETLKLVESLTQSEVMMNADVEHISGSELSDDLAGQEGSDIILGKDGDDTVDGGAGRSGFFNNGMIGEGFYAAGVNNGDFLFGGDGDDVVRGNAGNDLISGDAGDDELWGGSGFDTFVFTEGRDSICDFAVGVDTILLDALLLNEGEDIDGWLNENAVAVDGSLVLNFGYDNELTIHGVTDTSALAGSLELGQADTFLL